MRYSQDKSFKDKFKGQGIHRGILVMKFQASKIAVCSNKKKFTFHSSPPIPSNYPSLTIAVTQFCPVDVWVMPVWPFLCMIRNIHPSNKYGELVGDWILGLTLNNDPTVGENEKVLVLRLHSSGNAGASLQGPQHVSPVGGQWNGKCCSGGKKGLLKGILWLHRRTKGDKVIGGTPQKKKEFFTSR